MNRPGLTFLTLTLTAGFLVFCALLPVSTSSSDSVDVILPPAFAIPLNDHGWEALWTLAQKQVMASCKPVKGTKEFDCGEVRYRVQLRMAEDSDGSDDGKRAPARRQARREDF